MLYASNHAWAMYTGIAHGAYLCLKTHASSGCRACYLPENRQRPGLAHHVPDRAPGRQLRRLAALSRRTPKRYGKLSPERQQAA